jgi:hypothetical protein
MSGLSRGSDAAVPKVTPYSHAILRMEGCDGG